MMSGVRDHHCLVQRRIGICVVLPPRGGVIGSLTTMLLQQSVEPFKFWSQIGSARRVDT